MRSALQHIVERRTRQDTEAGYALLNEKPWNQITGFTAGVRGYAAALGAGTNWRQLRAEVGEVMAERWKTGSVADPEGKSRRAEENSLDLVIAQEWARRDLGAAITWYAKELPGGESSSYSRILKLLQAVDVRDVDRVAEWFEGNPDTGEVFDALVAKYSSGLAHKKPDELVVERLVQIPREERHRVKIISSFIGPGKKNGKPVLRNPPELLHRMIDAAQLSEGERERILAVVASTPFKGG